MLVNEPLEANRADQRASYKAMEGMPSVRSSTASSGKGNQWSFCMTHWMACWTSSR